MRKRPATEPKRLGATRACVDRWRRQGAPLDKATQELSYCARACMCACTCACLCPQLQARRPRGGVTTRWWVVSARVRARTFSGFIVQARARRLWWWWGGAGLASRGCSRFRREHPTGACSTLRTAGGGSYSARGGFPHSGSPLLCTAARLRTPWCDVDSCLFLLHAVLRRHGGSWQWPARCCSALAREVLAWGGPCFCPSV